MQMAKHSQKGNGKTTGPNTVVPLHLFTFRFCSRELICIPVYHILGAHLIERLVLLNSLRLRSWRVRSNMTDPELREILLTIRQMELKNILLYTSLFPEYKVLTIVSDSGIN